jgi:hypothetical protein
MRVIIIAAILAVSCLTQAQINVDIFEKAVNHVNCKAVELSLKNSSTDGVRDKFQSTCNCKDYPDFKQIKSSISSSETKTIELAEELNNLTKNEFKKTLKVDEVIQMLTVDIFKNNNKYKNIYEFANKRKDDPEFAQLKVDLKAELHEIFNSPVNNTLGSSVRQDLLDTSNPKQNLASKDRGWFDGFTFQIDVISIIFSLLLFILILKIKYFYSNESSDNSESIKRYVQIKLNEVNSNIDRFTIDFKKLDEEIQDLRREVKQLELKLISSNTPFEIVQSNNEQHSWQDNKQAEIKFETFFLSTPNIDGSFNESSASPTYKEGASIYKFTKIANNRAKFQIDERDNSIKFALTYPDKSIIPVCDSVNEYESKYSRIITLNAGEAELQNGKWVVNKSQKAKIRYEI